MIITPFPGMQRMNINIALVQKCTKKNYNVRTFSGILVHGKIRIFVFFWEYTENKFSREYTISLPAGAELHPAAPGRMDAKR